MAKAYEGYKVVKRLWDNSLMSVLTYRNSLGVTYYPQVWVQPRVGYLFLFKHWQPAADFRASISTKEAIGFEVWACEYEPAVRQLWLVPDWWNVDGVTRYWDQVLAGGEVEQRLLQVSVPEGTTWARRIRLTREARLG